MHNDKLVPGTTGSWRRVEGEVWRLSTFRRQIDDYRAVVSSGTVWVLVPDDRQVEFDLLVAEAGLTSYSVDVLYGDGAVEIRPPASVAVPCGLSVVATGAARHRGQCGLCRTAEGRPLLRGRNGPVTTISVPEMAGDMSMDGLVRVLQTAANRALELSVWLETAVTAVRQVPEVRAEIRLLEERLSSYVEMIGNLVKAELP